MDTDVCLNYEISERLSENYKTAVQQQCDDDKDLKLKLENIIQNTNFSDFARLNKNDKNNNDSQHSAKLIDKQEVNAAQLINNGETTVVAEDQDVTTETSTVCETVCNEQQATNTLTASISNDQSEADEIKDQTEIADKVKQQQQISESNSVNTSDLVNELSNISSTNLSSNNSSFDSSNTSDLIIVRKSSNSGTNESSCLATSSNSCSNSSTKSSESSSSNLSNSPALNSPPSSPASSNTTCTKAIQALATSTPTAINPPAIPCKEDHKINASMDPGKPLNGKKLDLDESIELSKTNDKNQSLVKEGKKALSNAPADKEPACNKQIKDGSSFKKERSFLPSLPKSNSADMISQKLKSNISSVSANSNNLFNKTISTISNNLLTNITNKGRNRAADLKKQKQQVSQTNQDNRKQEVCKSAEQKDKFSSSSSATVLNNSKSVRAQTIDEERIMNEHAEDYGSLNCDHEPGLEFDDSELEHATKLEDDQSCDQKSDCLNEIPYLIADANGSNLTYLETYDDLLEENWNLEEALRGVHNEEDLNSFFSIEAMNNQNLNKNTQKSDKDFRELAKYGIIEMAGDDLFGRRIITIYACRLPPSNTIDHDKLLRYIMYTLDQYVENDYCIVYFHHNLTSVNKPALSFLYKAYRAFDRRYKKNLKALYLVHPTKFIRFVLRLFKPLISVKFGKKVQYINHLDELDKHLRLEQLIIPKEVEEHDKKLMQIKKPSVSSSIRCSKPPLPSTQQFGVSLSFIKKHNNDDAIAPVVKHCIEYLNNHDALITEGLFRKSADTLVVKRIQERYNEGENVDLNNEFGEAGYHIAAVLLKSFLRKLDEPLFTFELYDDIMKFEQIKNSKNEKLALVKSIILQ